MMFQSGRMQNSTKCGKLFSVNLPMSASNIPFGVTDMKQTKKVPLYDILDDR
jgi:hypothetical protein